MVYGRGPATSLQRNQARAGSLQGYSFCVKTRLQHAEYVSSRSGV